MSFEAPDTQTHSGAKVGQKVLAGIGLLVALVMVVLSFLMGDHVYGEVSIPGSAIVHLPAGEVDATLQAGRSNDPSVPPLSMRITGPAGNDQPEIVDSPRTKCAEPDCELKVRVWVVRVPYEADYQVTVEGEVYGRYQPTVTFGRNIWNDALLALRVVAVLSRWIAIPVLGLAVIAALLIFTSPVEGSKGDVATTADVGNSADKERLSSTDPSPDRARGAPVQDLVLEYPKQGNVGMRVFIGLFSLLFIGLPAFGIHCWLHLPAGAPPYWLPIMVLGLIEIAGCLIVIAILVKRAARRRRRERGDGWLRLSGNGFELHDQCGKPRRYRWADIDEFIVATSSDSEGGSVQRVGVRFSPEYRAILARPRSAGGDRDAAEADMQIAGYWDISVEAAVHLMTEWLSGYRRSNSA